MGFKKMTPQKYPPRKWTLLGYPNSGKSTFATQMKNPLLVIDADHRFGEVLSLVQGAVLELSDNPPDNTNTEKIASLLELNMQGSDVGTIVIDSLTAIYTPLVTQTMIDNDSGRNRNKAAAFKKKALAMRQLQDSITKWGTDVLWIYHLQDRLDGQGKKNERPTISKTELESLTRSINMTLQVVQDGNKRGIKVIWARRGLDQMILWDESGTWTGMPERIERVVYDNNNDIPEQFPSIENAIDWSLSMGTFDDSANARRVYDELKQTYSPKTAAEMADHWKKKVLNTK